MRLFGLEKGVPPPREKGPPAPDAERTAGGDSRAGIRGSVGADAGRNGCWGATVQTGCPSLEASRELVGSEESKVVVEETESSGSGECDWSPCARVESHT